MYNEQDVDTNVSCMNCIKNTRFDLTFYIHIYPVHLGIIIRIWNNVDIVIRATIPAHIIRNSILSLKGVYVSAIRSWSINLSEYSVSI